MGSTKSMKSQLYYVSGATAATKVAQVVSASGFGGQAAQINTSTWDDLADTFVAGRKASGTVTCNVIFDPTDHGVLETIYQAGTTKDFLLIGPVISTGAAHVAPTVSGSAFTLPTTADSVKFTAYISDFSIDVADNDVWKGTLTLQMSGDRVVTAGT